MLVGIDSNTKGSLDSTMQESTRWIVFQQDRIVLSEINQPLLAAASISSFKQALLRQYLLGEFDDGVIYCAELEETYSIPQDLHLVPLKKALQQLESDWYRAAVKAYTIINWDKNHQYCGRCGNLTKHNPPCFERQCTKCTLLFYPRISPSIIVCIQREGQILMARGHHFVPGIYGLIAGFIEAGETIEEAVHREVKEEVGITIKNLCYFGSQAWPFPDSLMLAFTADYKSGDLTVNSSELEEAGWYDSNNLPGRPSSKMSIASKLIDHFIAKQKNKLVK